MILKQIVKYYNMKIRQNTSISAFEIIEPKQEIENIESQVKKNKFLVITENIKVLLSVVAYGF